MAWPWASRVSRSAFCRLSAVDCRLSATFFCNGHRVVRRVALLVSGGCLLYARVRGRLSYVECHLLDTRHTALAPAHLSAVVSVVHLVRHIAGPPAGRQAKNGWTRFMEVCASPSPLAHGKLRLKKIPCLTSPQRVLLVVALLAHAAAAPAWSFRDFLIGDWDLEKHSSNGAKKKTGEC